MLTLNGQISFTVKFDLTGTPTLKLQASTIIPGGDQPNLTGYFYIKQPDGISRTGDYITPDVAWSGSGYPEFSIQLRMASDGTYQRGDYEISFFAQCTGYTPGEITRSWNASFIPVVETLTNLFDLYTPSLKYRNDTVYTNGDFGIISQTELWAATCVAGVIAPSTTPNFDLVIGGNYYDSVYSITHYRSVLYQHNTNTWFSILQDWATSITAAAYIPAAMSVLLGYLDALKAARDANSCDTSLDKRYEDAAILYGHIRTKVCSLSITGLKSYFDEFYRLTHNYQNPVYVNTNSVIPPYDFTTGCTGGSGGSAPSPKIFQVSSSSYMVDGQSSKNIPEFIGFNLLFSKGGIVQSTISTEPSFYSWDKVTGDFVAVPPLATDDIIVLTAT